MTARTIIDEAVDPARYAKAVLYKSMRPAPQNILRVRDVRAFSRFVGHEGTPVMAAVYKPDTDGFSLLAAYPVHDEDPGAPGYRIGATWYKYEQDGYDAVDADYAWYDVETALAGDRGEAPPYSTAKAIYTGDIFEYALWDSLGEAVEQSRRAMLEYYEGLNDYPDQWHVIM